MPIKSIKPSYTEWVQEHNAAGTHSTINAQNIAVAGTASILSSVAASTLTTNMVKAAATQGLMLYDDAGTAGIFVQDGGNVGIGTTGPGEKLDLRDGNFVLSDVDVAHGITTYAATTDFFKVSPASGTSGGAFVNGFIEDSTQPALVLNGAFGVTDPTDTMPAILLTGSKRTGTTQAALGALETVFQIETGIPTVGTKLVTILGNGNVGIGTTGPLASLHADQSSTTGAKPVLTLDQADVDEEIIKFIATGAANLANTIAPVSAVTTATLYAYLRVNVQDDGNQIADQDYFMPLYTLV